MKKKRPTFPYQHSCNGRHGRIYKLANGTFKTHFNFAHKAYQNTFSSFEKAHQYLEDEFNKLDSERENAQSQFPLSRDLRHYWELEQRLKQESEDASLWQAVDFFLAHNKKKKLVHHSVKECIQKYIVSRATNGAASLQIKNLKKHLSRFEKKFGARLIHTIDAAEIEGWLNGCKDLKTSKPWSPKTKKSARGSIVSMARHSRKILRAIPYTGEETEFEKVPAPKVVRTDEVEIYTPEELKKILAKSIELNIDLIPIIVLGCWAGLRPTEAHGEDVERDRLTWGAFDWEENAITLYNQKVRTNRPRTIPIQSCAQKWLSPFKTLKGSIWTMKSAYDRRLGIIRKKAGVKGIIDGFRHSYASYRIKQLKGSLEELAAEMGNSPAEITRSYKRGVTEALSTQWFGILPPKGYHAKISAILKLREACRLQTIERHKAV
jgi:integrase